MKRHRKSTRRLSLTIPVIRKIRVDYDDGNLANWLIRKGEETGAGSVLIRYTLKKKPWILTLKAERNYKFKKRI